MLVQSVELLFLAGVAIIIIYKLLSMLGTTDQSHHNNTMLMNDIAAPNSILSNIIKASQQIDILEDMQDVLMPSPSLQLTQNLMVLIEKNHTFDPHKFIRSVKKVFEIVIYRLQNSRGSSNEELDALVDRSVINSLLDNKLKYSTINTKLHPIVSYVVGISFFANNVLIKTHCCCAHINEEWTFTRNINATSNAWYVTKIVDIDNSPLVNVG